MRQILKKTHLVIIIIYLFIIAYFALFNWPVFSVIIKVNIGFSIIQFPVVAMSLSLGLIFLLLQLLFYYLGEINTERNLRKKDSDIQSVKAALHDHSTEDLVKLSRKQDEIAEKLDKLIEAQKQAGITEEEEV